MPSSLKRGSVAGDRSRMPPWLPAVIGVMVALTEAATVHAITNGDFSQGVDGLDGWTTEALDDNDAPVSPPLIGVVADAAGNVAELETVPYGSPLGFFFPIATLSQVFTLSGDILSFDIGFDAAADTSEPLTGFGVDGFEVSLDDGTNLFTLLVLDSFGLSLDPFGDVASAGLGSLLNSGSTHPLLSDRIELQIDPTALAPGDVMLAFTMLNDLDGFASTGRVGQIEQSSTGVIPEPLTASLGLMSLGVLAWWSRRCRGGS